jgi:hypothetical protein
MNERKKLEKEIERRGVQKLYERIGCMQLKTSEPLRHFPDRMILLEGGRLVFVEFKRPKEELRTAQNFTKAVLEKLGFRVYVVNDADEYAEVISQL